MCGWSRNVVRVVVALKIGRIKGKKPSISVVWLVVQQNHREEVRLVVSLVQRRASRKSVV